MYKNSIKKVAFILFSLILINSFTPILNLTIFAMDLGENNEIIELEQDDKVEIDEIEEEETESIKENENDKDILVEEDIEKGDKLDLIYDNNTEKIDDKDDLSHGKNLELSEEAIASIYVDSENGNDSLNGDIDNPLKSLDIAIEKSNEYSGNTNIYLYPGDYNLSLVEDAKIYTDATIKGLGNKEDISINIITEGLSRYFNIWGTKSRININIENLSISNSENIDFIMFDLYNTNFNMKNIKLENKNMEIGLDNLGASLDFYTDNSKVVLNNIVDVNSIYAESNVGIESEDFLKMDNITFSGDVTQIELFNYNEVILSNITNMHSIWIDQVESLEIDNLETVSLIEEDEFIISPCIDVNSSEMTLKNINVNSRVENYPELIVLGNKIDLENICLVNFYVENGLLEDLDDYNDRDITLKNIKLLSNELINENDYTNILVFEKFKKVDIEDLFIESYNIDAPIIFASDINNLRINNLISKNNINNLISLDHVKNFDMDNINIKVDKVLVEENKDDIKYGIHTHTFDCQNPSSHKSTGVINNYKVNMLNKDQLYYFNNFFENSNVTLDRININVDNNLINNTCFHAIDSDVYLRNSKIGNIENKTTLLLDIVNSNLNFTNNSIINHVLGSNDCILQNDIGEELGKIRFEKGNANNLEFNNNIIDIKVNIEVENFEEIDNVYSNIKDNSEFNNNILLNLEQDDLININKENIFIDNINKIGFKGNDLDILSTSIAVDKGDNSFVDTDSKKDVVGNDRICNNIVDIGAYEYTKPIEYPSGEDNDTQQSYPESNNAKVKITYDGNGGLVKDKKKMELRISKGSIITEKVIAEREGYIFKGWSKVKDEEELFDFTKPINKDTTVYAIWQKDKDKLDKINHFEYIQGYPDRNVRPEENITREEVSAVFYRLLTEDYKQSIYSLENNFTDLSSKRWSNKHISTLANGDILNGYEDGEFKYDSFITRAEVATIASRFENLDQSKHNFTDVKGHWAEEYIASASKKGWVEGYKDGSFRPDEYITRAEFVTLVNRILNRGVKKENILEGIKEFKDLKDNTWYYEEFVEAINGHTFDRDNENERTSEKWLELKEFNMDM